MNLHDTERLHGTLSESGLVPASAPESADLVLLNTCSVREKPVQKILSRIGELAVLDNRPIIGVCGCVAQQEGESLLERSRSVGFVLGPGQVGRVTEAVRAVSQGERAVYTGFDPETDYNFSTIFRKRPGRGMVTVIEGCNEYCTFCIVPYTRGREVSRRIEDILTEVRGLQAAGVREVELLGQTVNAYQDPHSGASFADLLREVATLDPETRIRFITSHPRHFSAELIEVMAAFPNVSRYLHLPFQAGSDRILKRMNRKYTRDEYLSLVARIREAVPDITLSTDVIVGFPGERDEDFAHTIELLQRVRFGQVFAFAYSPRPRTPSRKYDDQVAEPVKKARLQELFALTDRISLELNQSLVGRTVEVLVDGPSRKREDEWQGRGDDNRVINFPMTGSERIGDIVRVVVTDAGPHSLRGRRADPIAGLPVVGPALTTRADRLTVDG